MLTPLGIVLVVFGILVCFAGYNIFQSMLPLWGFILGGFVCILFIPMVIKVPPVPGSHFSGGFICSGGS